MNDSSSPKKTRAESSDSFSKLRHDLRTPLNQILGYTEMLLEEMEESQQKQLPRQLSEILATSKHLLSLINKLLLIDHMTLELMRAELRKPLEDLLTQTKSAFKEAQTAGLQNAVADLQRIQFAGYELNCLVVTGAHYAATPSFLSRAPEIEPLRAKTKAEPGMVLVVDDSDSNRDMLARRLERQGHSVVMAENGQRALDLARQQPFDLVLLDIMMPELDGYQTLEQFKKDSALRHIPIIMLSALDELDSIVRCIEMGAEDYLPKPFNPVLLRARIGACLERKRWHDQEHAYLKQLEQEQEKSERLLLNVLPKPIADRLKAGETSIADHFPEVSILFADLVGFTRLSNHVSPAEVVNLLNEIFTAFDNLAAELGLEKIKTIGDSYMAAGGLPVPREDHAEVIAEMALKMQAETRRFNLEYDTSIQIRIGINLGSVIAGIIGKQKFIYDLWGDTVNVASRMESLAAPETILVTAEFYEKLQDKFTFQERGELDVKGKGIMSTWLLTGRK